MSEDFHRTPEVAVATAPKPPRRRNWFAFRLRTLLAVVAIFSLLLGGYRIAVQPYQQERLRWERFQEKFRAAATSNYSSFASQPIVECVADSAAPFWLRMWGEEDFCLVARSIYVPRQANSPEILAAVADFKFLEEVRLEGAEVNDEVVARFARHARLRLLDLTNTAVTDAGLQSLRSCHQLQYLGLRGTHCTSGGFEPLRDLPLEQVQIDFPLTAEVLRPGFPALRALHPESPIQLNGLSDSELQALETLACLMPAPALRETPTLRLSHCRISMPGAEALLRMPVPKIELQNCQIAAAAQRALIENRSSTWNLVMDRASIRPEIVAQNGVDPAARKAVLNESVIQFGTDVWRWTDPLSLDDWPLVCERLPQIEALSVNRHLGQRDLAAWVTLPNLRQLDFFTEIHRLENLSILRRAAGLERLTLYHGDLLPKHLAFLQHMPKLTALELRNMSGESFDPAVVREAVTAPALTELRLLYWKLTDEHVRELFSATALREIELGDPKLVTSQVLKELRDRLPQTVVRTQ